MSGLQEGRLFSEVVGKAKELGYTEPDPRDDLGGVDVARKALILARTLGMKLEMSDVTVEPMYPTELASLSVAGASEEGRRRYHAWWGANTRVFEWSIAMTARNAIAQISWRPCLSSTLTSLPKSQQQQRNPRYS